MSDRNLPVVYESRTSLASLENILLSKERTISAALEQSGVLQRPDDLCGKLTAAGLDSSLALANISDPKTLATLLEYRNQLERWEIIRRKVVTGSLVYGVLGGAVGSVMAFLSGTHTPEILIGGFAGGAVFFGFDYFINNRRKKDNFKRIALQKPFIDKMLSLYQQDAARGDHVFVYVDDKTEVKRSDEAKLTDSDTLIYMMRDDVYIGTVFTVQPEYLLVELYVSELSGGYYVRVPKNRAIKALRFEVGNDLQMVNESHLNLPVVVRLLDKRATPYDIGGFVDQVSTKEFRTKYCWKNKNSFGYTFYYEQEVESISFLLPALKNEIFFENGSRFPYR